MMENPFKKAREAAGMKQKEVAKALGVSQDTMWRLESGRRDPKTEEVKSLAKLYGVPFESLLSMSSNDSSPTQLQMEAETEKKPENVVASQMCERGVIYVDGKAIDTLARQLRDRLYTEFDKTAPEILDDVKDTLHQCLRIYEDNRIERKHA